MLTKKGSSVCSLLGYKTGNATPELYASHIHHVAVAVDRYVPIDGHAT